ncbi:MAG: DUF4345 family protein, partial [Polyangiales bacterium]
VPGYCPILLAMGSRYPSIVLWICALVFLGTAIVFTVMPQEMFAPLGLTVPVGAPLTELRAVYGGLEVAIGVFLLFCARRGGVALELGLLLSFLSFSGLAAYRGIGMGVDGPQVPMMSALLLAEAAGAMFALSGLLVRARGSSNA